MSERVSRAMTQYLLNCSPQGFHPYDPSAPNADDAARVVFRAMREPTEEMLAATGDLYSAKSIYQDMIDAAMEGLK